MTPEELRNNVINDLLLCDECGRLHLDDTAALSESCDCGRFKQRMEWATVGQVLDTIERLERENAELRRDAERLQRMSGNVEMVAESFNRDVAEQAQKLKLKNRELIRVGMGVVAERDRLGGRSCDLDVVIDRLKAAIDAALADGRISE